MVTMVMVRLRGPKSMITELTNSSIKTINGIWINLILSPSFSPSHSHVYVCVCECVRVCVDSLNVLFFFYAFNSRFHTTLKYFTRQQNLISNQLIPFRKFHSDSHLIVSLLDLMDFVIE